VDGLPHQLLAGAALAEDQYRSVGRRDELDLADEMAHGGTVAKQAVFARRRPDLVLQVLVLALQPATEGLQFLEGARGGNCAGGMIREDPEPAQMLLVEPLAIEKPEYAQQISLEDERLSREGLDLLALHPPGFRPLGVRAHHQPADAILGDEAHLAVANRNPTERAGEAGVVRPLGACIPGTRGEVQAPRLVGTVGAELTRVAKIAGTGEPDACEHD